MSERAIHGHVDRLGAPVITDLHRAAASRVIHRLARDADDAHQLHEALALTERKAPR